MAAQYKTVEYELGYMVCDGPEGPSLLTTLFNFLRIVAPRSLRIVAPRSQQSTPPYLEKKGIQDILLTLSMQICARKKQNLAGLCLNQLILDLGPQSYVTPILGSNVYFEETQEFRVYDIFVQLEIPICHCWVVDPDSKTICPNVENYSYEKLQKYSQVLENLSERVPDVVQKRAVVQNLLEAHSKQFTSYGYVTLCEQMQENGFIVLYWDNKFYVMHKHDGNLLLLETNSGILKEYPEVRWRVFEEVDRDTIYLNAHFSPANAQPNFARAVSWHQSKVSGRSVESSEPKGSGARTTLSKGQKKRLKNRLAKEAEAEALNKHDLGEDQQEASMEAASAVSDDKLGRTEGSDAEESRSQLPSDGNTDQSTSSQVPAVVSSKPNQQEAFNAALASSDDKLNQQEQSNRHEVSSEEHTVSHPSACGTSSHTIAEEDESKSTVGEDFLKFLLLFNDGTSRFKDGSSTERVPFFEGMVEALKFTGSPIFYVPFKFIEMYDTSLAGTIQDSYPRISKDLTESVCKYLANHGVDIAAQLEILHLPEPRLDILHPPEPSVQLFLDFVKDLDFLEEYDVFAFRLEYSPSYHSRKMALGYLHVIVDNFRKGRCFGGKWDESNMLVHQGSRFSIACEDQAFTPSLGYLDLCKFDACVLQRFKNSNGRLPIYFKELKDDFLLISDSFKDQKRWERFLLLISYPFALAAPIVRSTFVLDIYRAADSESSGKDYADSPLNTRIGIRDWRDKATAHSLFKYVYDHKNYGNGTWTSVYTFTKWAVSHWSLFKFSRHFISHVLRYTKIINGGQQVRDLAIVDIMLGRQLGPYIAQSIRFFIFNCDLDGLFSCPWRHFVSSDCMDKPKQTIAIATEKFEDETSTSAHSVSNSTSYMECAHRTGWAITRVGKDLSQEPLRWDALIANVDLTEFALFLEENAMEAVVAKEGDAVSLTCGTINVSKSYRQILVGDFLVEDTESDLVIAVEGPMCDDFHAVFELLCLWLCL